MLCVLAASKRNQRCCCRFPRLYSRVWLVVVVVSHFLIMTQSVLFANRCLCAGPLLLFMRFFVVYMCFHFSSFFYFTFFSSSFSWFVSSFFSLAFIISFEKLLASLMFVFWCFAQQHNKKNDCFLGWFRYIHSSYQAIIYCGSLSTHESRFSLSRTSLFILGLRGPCYLLRSIGIFACYCCHFIRINTIALIHTHSHSHSIAVSGVDSLTYFRSYCGRVLFRIHIMYVSAYDAAALSLTIRFLE